MNCVIVRLDSSLRLEVIHNEVNKLLGPKKGGVPRNADCKDVQKGRGCLVLGFELLAVRAKSNKRWLSAFSCETDTFPDLSFKGNQSLGNSQDEELKCACNWERRSGDTGREEREGRGTETRVSDQAAWAGGATPDVSASGARSAPLMP